LAERITITDGSLSLELERWLLGMLQGSEKDLGLYHTISHGVNNWDTYNNMVGMVRAYESVLQMMGNIAKQRGSAMEEQVILSRPGLN
jgi:hypothetical protein